jgi:hypothetical protein
MMRTRADGSGSSAGGPYWYRLDGEDHAASLWIDPKGLPQTRKPTRFRGHAGKADSGRRWATTRESPRCILSAAAPAREQTPSQDQRSRNPTGGDDG